MINKAKILAQSPIEESIKLIDIVLPNDLTLCQQKAYQAIFEFLLGDEPFFRLSGYAGTGKSFLLTRIIEGLRENGVHYVVATPTNKAAKNLEKLCYEQEISKPFIKTVAQLLKLYPTINVTTGEQEFISHSEPDLSDFEVVIIDEYSMLAKGDFQKIEQEIRGHLTKIIFVGDGAQLPPVKEKEPIVCIDPKIKATAELTEVVRYEGEIARIAEKIRQDPRWCRSPHPFTNSSDGTLVCLDGENWLNKAIEHFKREDWLIDADWVRVVAWRNRTVDAYNQAIRQAIYGSQVGQYVVGDRLIAKKPAFRTLPKNKKRKGIILDNSVECTVISDPVLKYNKQHKWDFYEVTVRSDEGKVLTLRLLTPECEELKTKELKKLANRALEADNYATQKQRWAMYYDLDQKFDNMAYAYALTCHKAQGSSIAHVFLDVKDMKSCPDLAKILYTGLTRTKQSCYLKVV